MKDETDEDIRNRLNVVVHGDSRRSIWLVTDTMSVKRLRKEGFSIRRIAEIARCSERTVQDVIKGLKDE